MYSLVIPVYRNEGNISPLLDALSTIATSLDSPMEVVFVVDGSPDGSSDALRAGLIGRPFDAKVVEHSRNFGSFAAIRTGLTTANGPYFAVMAADLQEPPELVVEFFRSLAAGEAEVCLGTRESRDDPWTTRWQSNLFWSFYRRLVQGEMPSGGVDVFGCGRTARDVLIRLTEANSSLVGQLLWIGFSRKLFPYHRRAREIGRSAWTWRRKVRYLLDSVFAFTDLPIALLTVTGLFGTASALGLGLVVWASWLMGAIHEPGYTTIVLLILGASSANLLGLGVLGQYVWRTFENSKRRPLALIRHEAVFGRGLAVRQDYELSDREVA